LVHLEFFSGQLLKANLFSKLIVVPPTRLWCMTTDLKTPRGSLGTSESALARAASTSAIISIGTLLAHDQSYSSPCGVCLPRIVGRREYVSRLDSYYNGDRLMVIGAGASVSSIPFPDKELCEAVLTAGLRIPMAHISMWSALELRGNRTNRCFNIRDRKSHATHTRDR
jgi:hypothetical protein